MANSRLEELRRRAQERIQQVRESMEREMGGPEPPPIYRTPAEPDPVEETRPSRPSQQSLEGPSLEGPSLEGPGLEVPQPRREEPAPRPERPRAEPRPSRAEARAQPQRSSPPAQTRAQQAAMPRAHHPARGRSTAAMVLGHGNLRRAILAQEILGKPLSLRPPREMEDL